MSSPTKNEVTSRSVGSWEDLGKGSLSFSVSLYFLKVVLIKYKMCPSETKICDRKFAKNGCIV